MGPFNGYLWLAVFGVLGIGVIGALLWTWRARRNLLVRQSIPANWPMRHRQPVNAQEREVWEWLCATFPAHRVSLKMPVTRFTQPLRPAQGPGLYKMLGGVYCTFTVCSPDDGHVMGCADVAGTPAATGKSRSLKQAVLTRCGIAYALLEPDDLPSAAAIRGDFLGEKPPQPAASVSHPFARPPLPAKSREAHARELEEALLAQARVRLSTALDRQRRIRDSEFGPLMGGSASPSPGHAAKVTFEGEDAERQNLLSGWQPNSFLAPLDR